MGEGEDKGTEEMFVKQILQLLAGRMEKSEKYKRKCGTQPPNSARKEPFWSFGAQLAQERLSLLSREGSQGQP